MQHITISAEQAGPLGLTLTALPDMGGCAAPADLVGIPIVDPVRFDERQTCHLVHNYLGAHSYAADLPALDGTDLPAYRTCSSFRAGQCRAVSVGYCLFIEPPGTLGWQRALRWRRLPSGTLCPAEDYQKCLDHERTWARSVHTGRQDER